MQEITLNGTWQLAYGQQRDDNLISPYVPADWPRVSASVPGNVELDLVRAGVLPEPSVGNNIYLLRAFEVYEWVYTRQFPSPLLGIGQTAQLVFKGLDCVADVWLNGKCIGHVENMLIEHAFNVTDALSPCGEENELSVCIQSAVLHGRKFKPEPINFAFSPNWESLSVRKAPHMYGWDIMPRLVTAGLWRDVVLQVHEPTHWDTVYWATMSVDSVVRTATVVVDWEFATSLQNVDALKVRLILGKVVKTYSVVGTHGHARLNLQDIELWWPRGYGRQTLYVAQLELLDGDDRVIDTHVTRIGIRTVECRYTDITTPEHPGEFVFVVNGERIFIKGTNWVPLDGFHSRDHIHLGIAMDMIADLNCNMIRCWGGNVYEDHPFFNRCDELGVLVWQDFAMACAIYPQTEQFASVIRYEAESIVKNLRNHPSLALWAGNNEIDESYEWAGTGVDPNSDILSRQVLPSVVRRLDPFRNYLPSSPYRSSELVREQKKINRLPQPYNAQPEQHLWGPRTDFKGSFYTSSLAHFASEIGYHGCPDPRTLQQFLDPGYVWPWSDNDQWLTHATRPHPNIEDFNYRIQLMTNQIKVLFESVPDNLDDYVLASQLMQAEAMKFFIEWFRQAKWRRTGILWWNLRDGWPIISDAIVDYYNRRKLAYEYVKRVQTDVCVIVAEPDEGFHPIIVVNDTNVHVQGHTVIMNLDSDGKIFEADFSVLPNGLSVIGQLPLELFSGMWMLSSVINNQMPMRNHYLVGNRPYKLSDYKKWLRRLDIPAGIGPEMG
jgi:beta-mannosidase